MEHLLFQFTLIILLTTAIGFVGRKLRLPLVLAYLFAGFAIGLFGVQTGGSIHDFLEVLSTLGVAFLLFLIGIELNIIELKEVGAPAFFAGIGQFVFTAIFGYGLSAFLGFGTVESLVIAISLTFSSTIIVIKLLNTMGDVFSLYGRISIGIMLVQDFLAIFALIFLSLLQVNAGLEINTAFRVVGLTLFKIVLLGAIAYVFVFAGKRIFGYLAKVSLQEESTELFLLGTVSWVLAFTFISTSLDLSLEIGAFLAGLSLSGTGYSMEIVAKIKPFRDFFIILFFVLLGTNIQLSSFENLLIPTVVFTLLVLLGNPFSVQIVLKYLGFDQRVNFFAGLTVSQIGEFSLIFATSAFKSGLIDEPIVAMITVVAVLTIALSSYMVMNGEFLYRILKRPLAIISKPRKATVYKGIKKTEWKDHVILIGAGRIGRYIFDQLLAHSVPVIMIDYDPSLVSQIKAEIKELEGGGWLTKKKREKKSEKLAQTTKLAPAEIIYGSVEDSELFSELSVDKARLVISTITHYEDNLMLVKTVKTISDKVLVWSVVNFDYEVETLKEAGVDMVIWPQAIAREHVTKKLESLFRSTPQPKTVRKSAKTD